MAGASIAIIILVLAVEGLFALLQRAHRVARRAGPDAGPAAARGDRPASPARASIEDDATPAGA